MISKWFGLIGHKRLIAHILITHTGHKLLITQNIDCGLLEIFTASS